MTEFAVIFDNDGVLVDSEGISEEAFLRAAREQGVMVDPARMPLYCGLTDADIARDLERLGAGKLDLPRFEARKSALYFELAGAEPGVRAFAGARTLAESLRDAGIPFAVASSGSARKVAFNLERAGLADLFPPARRVSAEQVRRGKPDPEIFLKAAALLGVTPTQCMVLEDSINGLKGARAAGMTAIGVATTFAAHQIAPFADHVTESLEKVTRELLESWGRPSGTTPP